MPLHATGAPDYDASAVGVAERTVIRCASNLGSYGTKYLKVGVRRVQIAWMNSTLQFVYREFTIVVLFPA
jgi:hypothetical protein